MADLSSLENLIRQSMELNVRYYSAVTSLAVSYYKDLATIFTVLREAQTRPPAPAASPAPPQTTQPASRQAQQAGVMVLEGEAGGQALGVFLVANNLAQEVSAQVVPSGFADSDGHTVHPQFTFDPEVIVLAPAEQLLVRVLAEIDATLEPGVRYTGEFAVPELSGTRIPIVLRRRPGVDAPVGDRQATVEASHKKSRSSTKSRSRRSKSPQTDRPINE